MRTYNIILIFCLTLCTGTALPQALPNSEPEKNTTATDPIRIQALRTKLERALPDLPGLIEEADINISNTSLSNFLRAVSQAHGINISVSDALNTQTVVNGFTNVKVLDLLLFLAKEYRLDIEITGNILSVYPYVPEEAPPVEKAIIATYDYTQNTLSTDLNTDPLPKVFRKLTEISGKNLLYTPELSATPLTLYIANVPFDIAMQKLAISNNLEYTKRKDGFYEFSARPGNGEGRSWRSTQWRNRTDVPYTVVDSVRQIVSVDLQNSSIADVIYGLTQDLNLDIFIASPLENAGTVTVKAERISFDELLTKMFEAGGTSIATNPTSEPSVERQNSNFTQNTYTQSQNRTPNTDSISEQFTFKKENNIYYFGTESQLTTRKIEVIPMMHRSIAMLGDANPSSGFGSSGFGNRNFVTGGTNYLGNPLNGGFNQSGGVLNRNQNNLNTRSSFSQNTSVTESNPVEPGAILNLLPQTIIEGLDIKIDTELNSFVVSGSGVRVEKFKKFIKYIDKPVPLILIEVMILEVNRNATVETGVEFGIGKEPVTDEGLVYPNTSLRLGASTVNRIIGGFDGFGSLNLGNVVPNFFMDIKAMETNGIVKILSTPKLSTLNGHKAYLSSGQTTYYEVVSQNIIGSQNPQTSEIVNYQPIDAELALEFKPFVAGDGQITLDIQVIQSNFSGERIAEGAPPDINSRRFSSIMRMQANDVAILGGIEQKIKNDTGSGVPILARIPIIKWLFSKRVREDSKRKLNVIIKPTIFY